MNHNLPIQTESNFPLSEEEISDARFRAKDRAWSCLAELFDRLQERDKLTYQQLADRIGRKKAQVHRWIDCPSNLTLESFGLLVEGLNSDFHISLTERGNELPKSNHCHPSVMAEETLRWRSIISHKKIAPALHKVIIEEFELADE